MHSYIMLDNQSSLILYQTPDGQTRIEVKLEDETVWLTQAQMAELFDKWRSTITEHISNIFSEGELIEGQVCRKFRQTASDWGVYDTNFYNLRMIFAVWYRVKSHRGIQFRNWASWILSEYTIKGFSMDDARLKEAGYNNSYFDELLDRIRDIRTSEKNFYYKVKEIYKLSDDYEESHEMTQKFFKEIQNKFHYAVHGNTASEVVYKRADADKPYMGLMTWKNQSKWGKVQKSDVSIGKNYLSETELKKLNLLVEQFLAFAETQAMSSKVMHMRDWIQKLSTILEMNDMDILTDAGKIWHDTAQQKAETEYEKYKKIRDLQEIENLNSLEGEVKKFTPKKKKTL